MVLKLKNRSPSQAAEPPFSWDDLPSSPASATGPLDIPSPPATQLPARDMKMFGARPLRDEYATGRVSCKHCKKPVLRSAFTQHLESCKKIRAIEDANAKKNAKVVDIPGKKGGTKRKAEDEADGPDGPPALKKKKPAPRITKSRAKGPIDYDKQCGVINDKGLPCSRALTCKSHSMGAKRAVAGRSRPYDELYLDWQRLHNPNFVEPVKRETKKEKKEKRDKEREEKRKLLEAKKATQAATGGGSKKKKGKGDSGAAANAAANQADDEVDEDIDSEVELDAMIKGVNTAKQAGLLGVPLAIGEDYSVGSWFVARRERLRCCRDQLYSAFMGNRGGLGGMVR